jgi:Leucine-rich repeat (LRR) protein
MTDGSYMLTVLTVKFSVTNDLLYRHMGLPKIFELLIKMAKTCNNRIKTKSNELIDCPDLFGIDFHTSGSILEVKDLAQLEYLSVSNNRSTVCGGYSKPIEIDPNVTEYV